MQLELGGSGYRFGLLFANWDQGAPRTHVERSDRTAAVLMPLFVWRCLRHPEPVIDLSVFGILFVTGVWKYGLRGYGRPLPKGRERARVDSLPVLG